MIISVFMPMARSLSKRSDMPGFTTSFSSTRPSTLPSFATASGVEPWSATCSTASSNILGICCPWDSAYFAIASAAPFR